MKSEKLEPKSNQSRLSFYFFSIPMFHLSSLPLPAFHHSIIPIFHLSPLPLPFPSLPIFPLSTYHLLPTIYSFPLPLPPPALSPPSLPLPLPFPCLSLFPFSTYYLLLTTYFLYLYLLFPFTPSLSMLGDPILDRRLPASKTLSSHTESRYPQWLMLHPP